MDIFSTSLLTPSDHHHRCHPCPSLVCLSTAMRTTLKGLSRRWKSFSMLQLFNGQCLFFGGNPGYGASCSHFFCVGGSTLRATVIIRTITIIISAL